MAATPCFNENSSDFFQATTLMMSGSAPSTNFSEVTAVTNSSAAPRKPDLSAGLIVGTALIALVLKLAIAFNTFGSNDVVTFYSFARSLSDHGLEWTYRQGVVWLPGSPIFTNAPIFNHPPLTAYFLRLTYGLAHRETFLTYGLTFPFLLRLPGIIADLVVVLALLWLGKRDARFRLPSWALVLFALSPVSLMVSGFHGNTDSIMVMFLVLASLSCARDRPTLCGLFLALSCQIKIIPLLLLPIFFFFWLSRRRVIAFSLPFVLASLALWAEPLLKFPALFLKNVLSYGSFWGIWGITYWLRMTNLPQFSAVTFYHFPPMQNFVVTVLKLIIIAAVLVIAWRRRNLGERAMLDSLAHAWIIFFVFAPGVCAQYMVWLAPFILILSPTLFAWLTVTSALFLFFFYNITAHGFPWYLAVSTTKLNTVWTPWTIWPWAALVIGMIWFWRKARAVDPSLRLLSSKTLPATASE
jgi:Gpi18-like mannosyltransferase